MSVPSGPMFSVSPSATMCSPSFVSHSARIGNAATYRGPNRFPVYGISDMRSFAPVSQREIYQRPERMIQGNDGFAEAFVAQDAILRRNVADGEQSQVVN